MELLIKLYYCETGVRTVCFCRFKEQNNTTKPLRTGNSTAPCTGKTVLYALLLLVLTYLESIVAFSGIKQTGALGSWETFLIGADESVVTRINSAHTLQKRSRVQFSRYNHQQTCTPQTTSPSFSLCFHNVTSCTLSAGLTSAINLSVMDKQ